MKKIYIAGSVAYDEIMDFPHHFKDYFHPEKLHQINVSFAVSDLAKHLGGITTNIVYALKNTVDYYSAVIPDLIRDPEKRNIRLDSDFHRNDNGDLYRSRVAARDDKQTRRDDKKEMLKQVQHDRVIIYPVAAVGRDGDELLEFFKKNNIDTTFVQKDEKLYTATGKVITDRNDNQIWGFYYGAAKLTPKLNAKSSKEEDFWVISATHEKPFTTTLRYVVNNKLPYLFDPGMTLTWIKDALLKKGVMNAKYVIGNDYEIAMIEKRLGMTVRELVQNGVNVITTLGEKGVAYVGTCERANVETIKVSAVRLKKVVDPTGAGDAWRGGFVGALAANKPMKECLIMGNVMASFAVEHVGTVEYTVNEEEIKRRMKSIAK